MGFPGFGLQAHLENLLSFQSEGFTLMCVDALHLIESESACLSGVLLPLQYSVSFPEYMKLVQLMIHNCTTAKEQRRDFLGTYRHGNHSLTSSKRAVHLSPSDLFVLIPLRSRTCSARSPEWEIPGKDSTPAVLCEHIPASFLFFSFFITLPN